MRENCTYSSEEGENLSLPIINPLGLWAMNMHSKLKVYPHQSWRDPRSENLISNHGEQNFQT